jgi:hypothetical protein
MPGARRDQQVRRRDRDALPPRLAGEGACLAPDRFIDGQGRQHALELAQHRTLPLAARAVPQFQADNRAPAGFAVLERALEAGAHRRIAIGTQEMDPR